MKKVLIAIAVLFGLILIAAILLPIIFKDDIRAAIDKEIDKNLNAKVYYDPDAFSISLLKRFPNVSVTVDDFGIVGVGYFEGDTLMDVGSFNLTLDLMSVIKGEQIEIVSVTLDRPNINVIVLEDGTANYDIMKETGEVDTTTTASEPVDIQINEWKITDGQLSYADRTLPMFVLVKNLNHTGSGDFSEQVFDMATDTQIGGLTLEYDGIEYLSGKKVNADITMAMDLNEMKFTFKENQVLINNFGFGFDGFVSMPGEDIKMDITYAGKENSLASVVSLIPGVYQEYLEGLDASGQINFDGFVKGTYNESEMPAVAANFSIENGQVSYAEYPVPMQNIQIQAAFQMPSADLRETTFNMDNFHMSLDGEEVTASLYFKDLEDYFWDFKMAGNIDLEKVTKVIPLEEDMTLRGKISANINTKGRMSDLEAERYGELPTSGKLTMNNFYYASSDLPQGFGIAETEMSFDPQKIMLTTFRGNAGKTDLNMNGEISNYLQYALDDSATVYGRLDFASSKLDVNEWMVESTEEEVVEDTTALEIVRIPENVDFVLTSRIDQIVYDNLNLNDFAGNVTIRNGSIILDNTGFNLLDGKFRLSGSYESAMALARPLYNFDFSIADLSIPQAFESFTTVQKWVPVAEKMTGKFSTDFKIAGTIGEGMEPVYEDMNGAGIIEIAQAAVKDVKILELVSSVTKLNQGDGTMDLRDVELSAEIRGGRMYVEPFDVTVAGRTATISGSTGVDGTVDYTMAMQVPSGQVGQALNNVIASVAGVNDMIGKNITLRLGITGTYDDPNVKLLGAEPGTAGGSATDALKAKAKAEIEERKKQVEKEIQEKKEEAISEAKEQVEQKKEEVREEVQKEVEEKKEEVKDKAEDAIKDLFGKKKKKN